MTTFLSRMRGSGTGQWGFTGVAVASSSVAGVILVEYLALSRLTVAVTAWPLRRVMIGIGAVMAASI
jgi:hypothetical protein